jgi:hypothetical protein
VVPIAGTVQVVWFGTDGTSYIVWETSVDPEFDVPSADVGCQWIANESNDGVDPVKVSGTVVDCDVTTDVELPTRKRVGFRLALSIRSKCTTVAPSSAT